MINKKEVTIAIADDHPMLLKGLFDELTQSGYSVISTSTNGEEALEQILKNNPMLSLLDIDMPILTGFEVIKMAKLKGSKTKFIILSFHNNEEFILQAKALQIHGYLLKEDSFEQIEECIKEVVLNRNYFSTSFRNNFLKNASEEIKKLKILTPSEITILKMAAQSMSNIEIAETLEVSIRTIEKHRSNIIYKLRLENSTNSLSIWALSNKKIIMSV